MIRGTTPTIEFRLPFEVDKLLVVLVTFAQNGQIKLTKTEAECELKERSINLWLTQEETLDFTADAPIDIELKVKTTSYNVLVEQFRIAAQNCVNDEVI